MSKLEQARFRRQGYLVIPGALSDHEVDRYADELDRLHAQERAANRLGIADSMRLPSATTNAPTFAALLDHPSTFPLVWSILGWNIHVYQSRLDVDPQVPAPVSLRWKWHQGGRFENVELAYWLCDGSKPGRGNLMLSPGSYRHQLVRGPQPDPAATARWNGLEGRPSPVGQLPATVAAVRLSAGQRLAARGQPSAATMNRPSVRMAACADC